MSQQLGMMRKYMAFLDMAALDLPKPAKVKAPSLVLGVARDNMLNPSEIEATAHAYNTQAKSSQAWRTTVCSSRAGGLRRRESWPG